MSNQTERPVRPVRCYFCGGQMYYADADLWEPEVRCIVESITLSTHSIRDEAFYAHARCWNERMSPVRHQMVGSHENIHIPTPGPKIRDPEV